MSLLEASNSLNFFSSKIFVKASQTTHHPLPSVSASSGDPLLQEPAQLSVQTNGRTSTNEREPARTRMNEQVTGTSTEWVQTNGRTSTNEHKLAVRTKAKQART